MSGEHRRAEAPQGPPWSLDLLADLHAGVLDEATAVELRQRVAADPEAQEILAALDATSAALADLPPLTIPHDVAARIDAALENEVRSWSGQQAASGDQAPRVQSPQPKPLPEQPAAVGTTGEPAPNNVVDLASRRRRRIGWLGAGLVAAAAIVTGVIVTVPAALDTHTDPQAANPPTPNPEAAPGPLTLHGGADLNQEQFSEVMRSDEYIRSLSDPADLLACLQANGVQSGKPLGAREITLDGRPGQLFILQGNGIGNFRLLAVGANCGPGTPDTIADSSFGG